MTINIIINPGSAKPFKVLSYSSLLYRSEFSKDFLSTNIYNCNMQHVVISLILSCNILTFAIIDHVFQPIRPFFNFNKFQNFSSVWKIVEWRRLQLKEIIS